MPAAITHLDNDGFTTITGYLWPDAVAGVAQTARKFGIHNTGTRVLEDYTVSIVAVGSNDGAQEIRIGMDTATLSAPYGVTLSLSGAGAGGIWSGTGLKYYRITAVNATGETIGSTEDSINVDVTTKKVTLDWTEIVGATSYKIYRSTSSGSYGASSLRATVVGSSTVTYTDDGDTLSAGTVPSANTTGGAAPNYGSVPSLDIVDLLFGDVAVGEQRFYWVNRVVALGTPETGNPRQAYLQFEETF